jgi:hypothetical protein
LQVIGKKDGDALLMLLTVRAKGFMRQHHGKTGDTQNRNEFYRGPLHCCPFFFLRISDVTIVPEKKGERKVMMQGLLAGG